MAETSVIPAIAGSDKGMISGAIALSILQFSANKKLIDRCGLTPSLRWEADKRLGVR